MKNLILIRGLPGSGKTTIAKLLETRYEISTDYFWEKYNGGEFDPALINKAHGWTEERVRVWMMKSKGTIVVHNTFTQPWEWEAYKEMAEKHDYRVHHIICEKRHDGESTSDVPQKTIDKMESRFQIRLQ